MSVETDVRTFLLLGGTTSSAQTYIGPQRKRAGTVPDQAIFVAEYGGPKPHGFMNGLHETYRRNDVQIWVRGPVNSYVATKDLADSIWRAMNRPSNSSISSASVSYVIVEPNNSGPIWLGEDDQERPNFSVNVRLTSHIFT